MKSEKEKFIRIAEENFANGFSCSQSVLIPFSEIYDLSKEKAIQISSGLGGGMGRTGGTCGAVSGALLVLGLRYGPQQLEEINFKEKVYEYGQLFCSRFRDKYGTLNCSDLLGCDVSTQEGRDKARAENRYDNCPEYVRTAVEMLYEMT